MAEGDAAGELIAFRGLVRFHLWGMVQARNWPTAAVVEVGPGEANSIARSPAAQRGDLIVDQMTIGAFAALIGGTPRHARRCLEQAVCEGRGAMARRMRATMANRDSESQSATSPADLLPLLVDALVASLGPNAASLRSKPYDWSAIRAVAESVIAEADLSD